VLEIQLNLIEGTMLGFEKNLSSSSRYQVKVARGIADISGSKYRLSAEGYLVLLEGNAALVFIPPGGQPVPTELKAPPAVYFSPMQGVKPAPIELVREVVLQTKGKLRAK
jgi:predicted YcjX-like family ATPase